MRCFLKDGTLVLWAGGPQFTSGPGTGVFLALSSPQELTENTVQMGKRALPMHNDCTPFTCYQLTVVLRATLAWVGHPPQDFCTTFILNCSNY